MSTKSQHFSHGDERPRPSRDEAREEKHGGEVNRVPAKDHTLAEPTNAGEGRTSDLPTRPASKPAMSSHSANRCMKPRQNSQPSQLGSGQGSRKAGGEPVPCLVLGTRGKEKSSCQSLGVSSLSNDQIPHGVESDSKADQGKVLEPGNPVTASFGMTEATGDRDDRGRSLRSSQRAGKPSTGQRETVKAASKQEVGQAPGPVNTGTILDMQRKLHRWSRNNPRQVFSDLFNLVCARSNLLLAWQLLSKNAGSRTPGIDGVHRRKVQERPGGVTGFLEEIRDELRKGTYKPQPVRQRLIPKPGKPGKFRPLGIPTLKDRLVQMALKNILEPIYEADFCSTSYGFRRGRSTLDALAMIQKQLGPTKAGPSRCQWIIEGDIKGCFDNIDHHILMERVRLRIGDKRVLRLILAFLKAGIMAEGSLRHPVAGTPQGGIISPLLANIHLTALDERYRRWTPSAHEPSHRAGARRRWDYIHGRPSFFLVRYADDFVVLVTGSQEETESEKAALTEFLLQELRMELSQEKTLITRPEVSFHFLGYRVIREPSLRNGNPVAKLRIPKEKLQLLRDRIKSLTSRSTTGQSFEDLLKKLNPIIAGWRNYYRYAGGATKEFNSLDRWCWERCQLWLQKKHPKASAKEIRKRFAVRHSPTRWTWGEGKTRLRLFCQGGACRYRVRGFTISNGWNDELDGVRYYPEVARPISGFTWLGEFL